MFHFAKTNTLEWRFCCIWCHSHNLIIAIIIISEIFSSIVLDNISLGLFVSYAYERIHYSIWEWTFHSKINTQDSGFLCTSLKKVLCYIYTRYAQALFILLWLICWRAFFVSFRHFSKCCTLLCLSCRPGKEKGRENTLKLKNEANLQSVAIQNYSNHTITIHKTSLIRKTKLTISIQIDSTRKEVLLRWAQWTNN